LISRLQPDRIEDVSAVLALYRPDSMEFLEKYIYYKHHTDEVEYWHPDMIDITKDTFGSVVYQEQLMNIVRKFGGRTMGGADKFRKAIGKKDVELVKKESAKIYQEIVDNGYTSELATKISEYLASKGGYLFNLSHSMLYSVLTLQTAYLKKHYPEYFFKALLNQNIGDYGSLNKYIIDAKDFGVKIAPPNVNKSMSKFSVENGKILFGLSAIKGIGDKFVDQVLLERENGKFESLENFIERIKPSVSQIVDLVKSGSIPCKNKKEFLRKYGDSLFVERPYKSVISLPSKKILETLPIDLSSSETKEEKLIQYNWYKETEHERLMLQKRNKHNDDFSEKYLQGENFWEFETLSIFVNENPFQEAQQFITTQIEDVLPGEKCLIAGIISDVTKKKDRNKNQFAFINIYSTFGLLDITFWGTQYKQYQELIKKGESVTILCKKTDDNRLVAEQMKPYSVWLSERKLKKQSK